MMNTYIILLRGINVGGKNKIKMADLKAMCVSMGYQNVQTYIQSGNIVLETTETNVVVIEEALKQQIKDTFGYDIAVLVRTPIYWANAIAENPFLIEMPEVETKLLHLTFLAAEPSSDLLTKLEAIDYGEDQFKVVADRMYLYFPNGYGRTKLTNTVVEKKLQVAATTRNWRTVNKLLDLAKGR